MIVESRTVPVGEETYRIEIHKERTRFFPKWHCNKCHQEMQTVAPASIKELALSLALDAAFKHHADRHATVTAELRRRETGGT